MADKLTDHIKTGDPDPSAMETRILADAETLKAADGLEFAARFYKDFVVDHTGNSEVVPIFTEALARLDAALAAYSAKRGERE